jgi:hypothetical protein
VQEEPARDRANRILRAKHYLGATSRGEPFIDADGVIVVANPSSRRLPQSRWAELVRWCIIGGKNAGTRMWAAFVERVARHREWTTIVSYSDPSAGHDGALYRASGWLWAPTWHRLRPPPTGQGEWSDGKVQAVKDRWVFLLRPDAERERLLAVADESITRRMPWVGYVEPAWKRGRAVLVRQHERWSRWRSERP